METIDSIYFYGHNNEFGYLSNFYKCNFVENDIKYNCSEQYFMYHKCLLFDEKNKLLINKILNETNQYKIKKYGRMVQNFNEVVWIANRYNIMKQGVLLKFFQNNDIKNKLLNTQEKKIFEASQYDKIWGIGYNTKIAYKIDKEKYGLNLLGKVLLEVREEMNSM
tara:strand:- start:337 stop:831 length:495 start_codon:yes stop_codon:yes gene_type:complete